MPPYSSSMSVQDGTCTSIHYLARSNAALDFMPHSGGSSLAPFRSTGSVLPEPAPYAGLQLYVSIAGRDATTENTQLYFVARYSVFVGLIVGLRVRARSGTRSREASRTRRARGVNCVARLEIGITVQWNYYTRNEIGLRHSRNGNGTRIGCDHNRDGNRTEYDVGI